MQVLSDILVLVLRFPPKFGIPFGILGGVQGFGALGLGIGIE